VKVEAIGNLFGFLKPSGGGGQKRKELVESLLEAATEKKPDEDAISKLVGCHMHITVLYASETVRINNIHCEAWLYRRKASGTKIWR